MHDANEQAALGAGSSQPWRCTSCGELSQGFAFAYGSCPACGGKLEMLDARRSDAAAALKGIRMAFEIELGGRAFYQRAAAETPDPALRTLFGLFAVMEGEHMEALSRRYGIDVSAPSPELRIEVAAVFAGVAHRPQDPANLFQIAIALEKRAAQLFSERAAQAAVGSAERKLFEELAAEEREHADVLSAEFARWRDAAAAGLGVQRPAAAATTTGQGARINAAALLLQPHEAQRVALVCGEHSLSYGELRERVARCAAIWNSRGLVAGDRVAIKLNDGCDWVVAFLGTLWAGGVAVAVNPRIPPAEWQYIVDEAGFHTIVAESADDTPPPWNQRVLHLADWQAALAQATPVSATEVAPLAPALWCHSSGTSGKPKAVVHGHRIALQIEQVSRDGLGVRADDRLFASSKLFFAYPQTNSLLAGLKLGATVVLDPQWPSAQTVVATVRTQRPTVLFCVPSLYRNLLNEGLAPTIADCGVRLCVSAGEALPASLRKEWQRQTGLVIVDGYGASETLVLVMTGKDSAVGLLPSPGIEIRPLSDVPTGAPTRIAIRAPTLALGYLDRPQAQAEAFRDGCFCPADLFSRNEAGGWQFAGREDSLVKIHGRWVNLVDLEERLTTHTSAILEAAAVCVPDADGVDAVAFFYVPRDKKAAEAALLERAAGLPTHQRPRWLHAVPALPRGPTGKLLRRKLQELHRTLE